MQSSNNGPSKQRPAFHFYPVLKDHPRKIQFRVFALLPTGGSVLLGETLTHDDALACARLIQPGSAIETKIERV